MEVFAMKSKNLHCMWLRSALTLGALLSLLALTAPPATAGSFSESIVDTVKCGSLGVCAVVRTGSFNSSTVAFKGQGVTPGDFNESSAVVLTVNGTQIYSGVLGDDPSYHAGKRSATLIKSHVDSTTGKTIVDLKIVISAGASGANIRVIGKISSHQSALVADQFLGTPQKINEVISGDFASIQLGAFSDATGPVGIVGTSTVKQVTKRGNPFTLDSVRLHSVKVP
jgi:hypothetical protein